VANNKERPQEIAKPQDDPCLVAHPDLVKCGGLGTKYVYPSENAACKAACGGGAKAVKKAPSLNGPCANQGGYHYRCQIGGSYCGHTASCCPCCEPEVGKAVQKTRCRFN